MNKLLIVGAGGHGRVVYSIAQATKKWVEINFLDDDLQLGLESNGKIIGAISDYEKYINEYDIFVAIGNNKMRMKIFNELESIGGSIPSIIAPNACVDINSEIAKGVIVMPGVVVNCGVYIGSSVILNTGSCIDHDCSIDDFTHISPGVTITGNVHIGKCTWIGAGATIIPGVKITNDVLVGAGSLVLKDINNSGVYVGMPVRRIK